MSTKSLKSNTKLLAVMLGVALCATLGASLAYAQTAGTTSGTTSPTTPPQIQGSVNLQQMLLSSIHTKFTDAANTAAGAVTNGQVIGGSLTVIQGSVVYSFKVFDGTNIYSVIVDAGNGKVLNTSQGHPMHLGALLGGEHGMRGHHIGGNAWKSYQPSTTNPPTTTPSTTTPSTGT
ncbi:MAG TPA: PepSY domain-containing protein [Nitrosopumilaceae archaeon]|nr:PepSY domain-containing protein [Nitrosopumilaceae archaeon]